MAVPDLTLRIAFATDPFSDSPSWDDVSADLLALHTKRGRQHQLDRFEAGTATFLLDNSHGNYWALNTGGDYYPNVKKRRRVNLRAQLFTNLLTNPSFETGSPPSNWTAVRSTLAREASVIKVGDYALKITSNCTADNANAYQDYAGYAAMAGKTVTLGAWVRCPAANNTDSYIRLADGVDTAISGVIPKDDAWHWVTVTLAVDDSPSYLRTQFFSSYPIYTDSDDILYVDGAVLVEGTYAIPTTRPDEVDGTFDLYTGFVKSYTPVWLAEEGLLHPCMQVECADLIRSLSRAKINDGTGYSSETSGVRVGNVLDDAGWNAAERALDTGKVTLAATGAIANVAAMEHLFSVQDSELGLFWIRGDGYAVFQQRGARAVAPYDASQATFGDSNYPIHSPAFSDDDDRLFNEIRLTREGGTEQVLSDSDSIDDYGLSTLAKTGLLFTSDAIAYLYCTYYLARYKDSALRIKSLTLMPQDPNYEAELWQIALGYELSTRITVIRDEADIDAEYFLEGVEHDYDYRRGVWTTKWQLSDASNYLPTPTAIDEMLNPDGAGSSTQLTPSAGANWQCVDEYPASDADYVTAYGLGAPGSEFLDLYTLSALAMTDTVINSVTVHARWRGGGYEAPWGKIAIQTGGVTFYGTQHPTTGGVWTNISEEWTTNPNTGNPWTPAEVNALQAGMRVAYNESYCSQVYVVVNHTPEW